MYVRLIHDIDKMNAPVKLPSETTMEMLDILTTVHGKPITVEDVTVHLKVNGTFRNAIYQLIEAKVVALKCQEFNIRIGDNEFHEYADTKRRLLSLSNAIDMNRYCRWHGIVMDQWNAAVRQEILRKKLREAVVTATEITAYFEKHKDEFKAAYLLRIVCADHEEARQVKERVVSQGEDFSLLARRVSIEKSSRMAGGYLGCIKYGTLPKPIDQAIFSAQPGQVLGPFEQSGYWVLYKAEEISNPILDENMKKNISDQLFAQWLQREVLHARA
jgi:peptidylprolyl isomerase